MYRTALHCLNVTLLCLLCLVPRCTALHFTIYTALYCTAATTLHCPAMHCTGTMLLDHYAGNMEIAQQFARSLIHLLQNNKLSNNPLKIYACSFIAVFRIGPTRTEFQSFPYKSDFSFPCYGTIVCFCCQTAVCVHKQPKRACWVQSVENQKQLWHPAGFFSDLFGNNLSHMRLDNELSKS